jgi:hypothetical protein
MGPGLDDDVGRFSAEERLERLARRFYRLGPLAPSVGPEKTKAALLVPEIASDRCR